MIQIYADDFITYDSRLEESALAGLTVTTSTKKAGTAEIIMPPGHPAYDAYTSYRSIVRIYRDDELLFRGRVLYPEDDFYKRRTITCEGERNFFRDGVHRPYIYQDSPAAIFAEVVELYNAQVEAVKQFRVGLVTATDPNNYIRLESTNAEQFSDTLDKLIERVGGFIVFTTAEDGARVVNWLAEMPYRSGQVIEFGSNLLDYASTGANTDLATVIVPYGAKDEETGERVTIESVNDGLDFIQDFDAVALRGVIARPVYWDDITQPANLLAKAQQYLAQSRNIVTSLTLRAVDLSLVDASIDRLQVGDTIRVRSKPHRLDADFELTDKTEDLLQPQNSVVQLGKDEVTLTGADAAGDNRNAAGLNRVEHTVAADYALNINAAITETKTTLSSLIQQTSEALRLEVMEQVVTGDEVNALISSSMEQLAESFTFTFTTLEETVNEHDASNRAQFDEIQRYIRFEDGEIILGESNNELVLRIDNDRISFLDAGAEVAYFSNHRLVVTDGRFLHSLRVGNFEALPRDNGNLSVVRVVE